MKVLVTGANGLIGSHVVRELLKKGYEVRAFVRETSDLHSLEGLDVELVYGDILLPETLRSAMKDCEMVFHVAAVFAYWGYDETKLKSIAGQGTCNVVEAAAGAGVKKIILTSSSAVLGSASDAISLDENHTIDRDEYLPPYVRAKIEQEKAAFRMARELNLDLVAVCPTITVGGPDYGLSESNRIIVSYLNDPFKATWPGGCNVVSASDVAIGHVIAGEKGIPGQRYLLGSENIEWSELHQIISDLCGLPGPMVVANHTSSYLAAVAYELVSYFTGEPPASTRAQAKMVGRYYWYTYDRIAKLGYKPCTARQSLVEAVSWLVASSHISSSLRATIKLSDEIYRFRNKQQMSPTDKK